MDNGGSGGASSGYYQDSGAVYIYALNPAIRDTLASMWNTNASYMGLDKLPETYGEICFICFRELVVSGIEFKLSCNSSADDKVYFNEGDIYHILEDYFEGFEFSERDVKLLNSYERDGNLAAKALLNCWCGLEHIPESDMRLSDVVYGTLPGLIPDIDDIAEVVCDIHKNLTKKYSGLRNYDGWLSITRDLNTLIYRRS